MAEVDHARAQIVEIVGVAARPGDASAPLRRAVGQTQRMNEQVLVFGAEIPIRDLVRAGAEVAREFRHVNSGMFAARLAALERDRPHQGVARRGFAFQARQHARENIEIARAADLPPRGVDHLDRGVGRAPDDRREQPRDRRRAL